MPHNWSDRGNWSTVLYYWLTQYHNNALTRYSECPQYCTPSTLDCTTNTEYSIRPCTVLYYWLTTYHKNDLTRYSSTRSVPQHIGLHGLTLYYNDALSQLLHTNHIYLISHYIPRRWERTTNPYTMCIIVLEYCTLLYNMTLWSTLYWSIVQCTPVLQTTVQRTHRGTNHDQRGFFCFPTYSGVLRAWIYLFYSMQYPRVVILRNTHTHTHTHKANLKYSRIYLFTYTDNNE